VFAPKPIHIDTVSGALAKAERYRLLNEPHEAESICLDILGVDPGNQQALVSLILALTDQIPECSRACPEALTRIKELSTEYDRAYYEGIVWERRAKARYAGGRGAHEYVYDWLVKALDLYAHAEQLRPQGNDDAVLRWNACVRFLQEHRELAPRPTEELEPILLE